MWLMSGGASVAPAWRGEVGCRLGLQGDKGACLSPPPGSPGALLRAQAASHLRAHGHLPPARPPQAASMAVVHVSAPPSHTPLSLLSPSLRQILIHPSP